MTLPTYKGTTHWICATAQNSDLDATAFGALTWVKIGKAGNGGEWSQDAGFQTYSLLETRFQQKQKGTANAGDPVIEVSEDRADAGQDLLRIAAAQSNSNAYAVKRIKPNGVTQFNRAVIGGPEEPGSGGDDFILHRFTLGFLQETVTVEA